MVKNQYKEVKDITDKLITWPEVITALKSNSNKRAGSIDKIPAELYKLCIKDKKCRRNLNIIVVRDKLLHSLQSDN